MNIDKLIQRAFWIAMTFFLASVSAGIWIYFDISYFLGRLL